MCHVVLVDKRYYKKFSFIWEKKADRSWELRNVSSNIGCGKGKNEILSAEKVLV